MVGRLLVFPRPNPCRWFNSLRFGVCRRRSLHAGTGYSGLHNNCWRVCRWSRPVRLRKWRDFWAWCRI